MVCPVDVQIYKMQYLQRKESCGFGEFVTGRLARDCHVACKISAEFFIYQNCAQSRHVTQYCRHATQKKTELDARIIEAD